MASSGLELLLVSLPQLAKGAAQTLAISDLSIVFSSVGGVLYGVLRSLNQRALNLLLRVYLELFRAIPVLVILVWFFFAVPILTGVSFHPFWAAFMALTLHLAAYVADVGLGRLVFTGLKSGDYAQMLAGSLLVTLIALTFEIALAAIQRAASRRIERSAPAAFQAAPAPAKVNP